MTFAHVPVYRPDMPHILRWVDHRGRIIYDNTAANPDAKIIKLV